MQNLLDRQQDATRRRMEACATDVRCLAAALSHPPDPCFPLMVQWLMSGKDRN